MKDTKLYEDQGLRTFLLVMDKGDEAIAEVTAFAKRNSVTAASLTAIGACDDATLGYFDAETSQYRRASFKEQMEIASCIGGIAEDQGEPALHAHVVLGRKDFSAVAGHLHQLHVFPTMEIVLTETPAHLRKHRDSETGMAFITAGASTGASRR